MYNVSKHTAQCKDNNGGNWHDQAVRHILKLPKRAHITPALKQLGWMKLEERRGFHTTIMVRKCAYGLDPEYLTSTFKMRNMVDTNHKLRGFKNTFVPRPKTNWCKNTFSYRGDMTRIHYLTS